MMNCKQATRLMSEAMERPLTFQEKASLSLHRGMCSGCRNFGKQMGEIRNLCQEYAHETGTEELKENKLTEAEQVDKTSKD